MPPKPPANNYRDIFYHSAAAMLILLPDGPLYTISDVNDAYLQMTNTSRQKILGQPLFTEFPPNPAEEGKSDPMIAVRSIDEAVLTKKPSTLNYYRFDIPNTATGEYEERYWHTTNTPVLNEAGEVSYIIHSPADVTHLYKLKESKEAAAEALKIQRQQLYYTFMQAPVGIAIYKGPNYVVNLINPPMCQIYGKAMDELLGKPLFETLPHAGGKGFQDIMDKVRLTGESHRGEDIPAPIIRNGRLETAYLNFVYEPFRESDGTITGIIATATEVTEQVLAKVKLKEAEERARLAVDAVGLGTFDLNLQTGQMITSPIFARIFGFDGPVSRAVYLKAFHPDDIALRDAAIEDAIISGVLLYEARIIRKDGSTRWVKIEGRVSYDDTGTAIRIIGTLLDVTLQRHAMEEQQKLITLVDNSVDLMSILGMDGANSYINAAGMQMLGFETEEEVKTIPISQLHTSEHFEFVQTEVLPSVMTKGRWAGTMLVRHLKTGDVFPVFNSCIRIDDPVSGMPIAVGAVMRDLRPELAAKQALADSEQLLRSITTAAPTTLWMCNEEGEMTYFNQTWVEWTGLSLEDSVGKGWLKAVDEKDRSNIASHFTSVLSPDVMHELEFRLIHVDGTTHWCMLNGQPQYTNSLFTGYIGACVDITDQKNLQQQKDDFIGIASHELKTPVTSIKAYTQVLEKMFLRQGHHQEAAMIVKMDGQINRLTNLIGDLLDVTKINAGKLQFNDREFDFIPMVKELVEDLQRTTETHDIIEQYEEVGVVYGDRERIGQVISNLLTNAIKYSPQANKVIVSASVTDGEVQLRVQDFGIGISNDKLCKVFEQFYRVGGDMQHTFPGLGLGLYISAEIIKREGGEIWVTSSEGAGSTFCFSLPLLSLQR